MAKVRPRVSGDAEREELGIFPSKQTRTDGEIRIFLEDEFRYRVARDFANARLPCELVNELTNRVVSRLRMEVDFNMERIYTEDEPFSVELLSTCLDSASRGSSRV